MFFLSKMVVDSKLIEVHTITHLNHHHLDDNVVVIAAGCSAMIGSSYFSVVFECGRSSSGSHVIISLSKLTEFVLLKMSVS